MAKYIVWVGGIPDSESESLSKALEIYDEWVDDGYDDVVIEIEENSHE